MSDVDEEHNWTAGDPASIWFAAYCQWEIGNLPEAFRDRVGFVKRGDEDVHVDHLFIESEDRSKGYGRKIMEGVTATADLHGINLSLDPAWIGEEDEPYDLSRWYEQFGFVAAVMHRKARSMRNGNQHRDIAVRTSISP